VPSDAVHAPFGSLIANDGRYVAHEIDPHVDIAALQYTGGTTGVPKGVCLTHGNLCANAMQISAWFTGAEPGRERILAVLPFFHAFGMTAVMNLAIALGGELVMLPRFVVRQVLRSIERTRATLFLGVPTIFRAIADFQSVERYDLSSLKVCVSGGDTLPMELSERYEALTGCRLTEGYGLTECSPVVTCNPFAGAGKRGSVGLPLARTSVEIVSLSDGRTPVPIGQRGEISVSGPQVMAGYWRRPDETAGVLTGGRLRTGDVGYMDEDGYTYIVDRLKDVIITGGYNVYPRYVEAAIRLHPGVADAAVIGVPDSYWGQIVKAYIVPSPEAALHERGILDFLSDKLSPIEIPKQIEFRDSLPKSLIGKILKRELSPTGGPSPPPSGTRGQPGAQTA
jgi:long-chain acyl-CoA synthetase